MSLHRDGSSSRGRVPPVEGTVGTRSLPQESLPAPPTATCRGPGARSGYAFGGDASAGALDFRHLRGCRDCADGRPSGGSGERKARERKGTSQRAQARKAKAGEELKRPSKKDRGRWKRYTGRQGPKANCEEDLLTKYREARQLEAAPSTVRSRLARLRTWDRAVQELVTRELAPRPGQEGFLTADLLKKGAAWLRANGYRSADPQ